MTAPGRYFAISDAERSLICLRLVIEALAEHEKYSDSETDWESLYHMAEISTGLVQALDQMRQDAWQETDGARAEAKRLQQQLDAQQPDVDAMRSEVERLRKFVEKVRSVMDSITGVTSKLCGISEALAELEAQPAPVAENGQKGGEPLNTIGLQQELIGDLLHKNQRIRTFVEKVRTEITRYEMSWASWHSMKEALAELNGQPAPVAETAEGGT